MNKVAGMEGRLIEQIEQSRASSEEQRVKTDQFLQFINQFRDITKKMYDLETQVPQF